MIDNVIMIIIDSNYYENNNCFLCTDNWSQGEAMKNHEH